MSSPYERTLDPSPRMLRQFSILWILFFGALAARQAVHQRPLAAIVLLSMSLIVGSIGIMRPRAIRPVFIWWMKLAYPIGWVVSRVVLGAIFFGLFTPVALVFRVIGRDALRLKPQQQAPTYWRPKPSATSPSHYFRQF